MVLKMGKLLLLMMTGLALMTFSTRPTGVMADGEADAGATAQQMPDVAPTEQEKTILSTVIKSFKNGHVDLTTLASALNDPNINRLVASLNKANLTKLADALGEKPSAMSLEKLAAALGDPSLDLDKVVAAFGDPKVLPPTSLKSPGGIMDTMKGWATQVSDTIKSSYSSVVSPTKPGDPDAASKEVTKESSTEKEEAELERILHETDKTAEEGGSSAVPAGFERSTPRPDANTYGKSLMGGVETTSATTVPTVDVKHTGEEGEESAHLSALLNHKMIYVGLGVLFGLSMCIFLATRFAKSYRGEEVEETFSTMRMSA